MPLSDLPTEIILDIADQLDDAGMNALAHTNSQIYQFLNKYLYRHDVTRARSRSLTWAIENRVETTVQQAVDAGGHLDPIPECFHIALQDSAARGDVNLVAALLKLDGINPNLGRNPPLVLAAHHGHSTVVGLLLAMSNIDPNVRDEVGLTPLYHSCLRKHPSVVRQLLARDDIDLNTHKNTAWTPLILAIESRNMEVINLLLSKDGIDVNLRPEHNITPVMMAIKHGPMEIVESLLARDDLDLSVLDRSGNHVLLYSMRLGLDKVKLILDRTNVDPDFVGVEGGTALMNACSADEEALDLIEFLLDQGVDANRQDAEGLTAFCYAVIYDRYKVIKFLLNRDDIDPNLPDAVGYTPLFQALFQKNLLMVDLLLRKKGFDVNAKDNDGSTALAYACTITRHVPSVGILLSHRGIDPNIVDNHGVSVLSKVRRTRGTNRYNPKIEFLLCAAGAR